MELKNLKKGFTIGALIFFLIIGSNIVYAKDNQSSPLFEESLDETLEEFNSGTKRIYRNSRNSQYKNEANEAQNNNDKRSRDIRVEKKASKPSNKLPAKQKIQRSPLRQGLGAEPAFFRPTFFGSNTCRKSATCRGIKCIHFPKLPTLCGSTCSITCGRRSTCAGYICKFISPYARVNSSDRLAENKEKPYTFTIF